jgi:inner membrane protein
MPTPMTHAAVGAAFGTLLPPGRHRLRATVALAALAASPDIDGIGFLYGVPYSHPWGHRGIAHSLAGAAVVALVTLAVAWAARSPLRRHPVQLLLVSFAAVASHGLLDAMTNGGLGVGLLMPFVRDRFFFPFRPIEVSAIDPRGFLGCAREVLTSELAWVWLPGSLILAAAFARRARARGRGDAAAAGIEDV